MAPRACTDTNRAYKEGTTRITTWLIQAAERCGADLSFLEKVESSSPDQSGSSESSSKTTKQLATKHKVPLREFKGLASDIASSTSPTIRLPRSVTTLIRSVITLRKQANEIFAKLSLRNEDTAADDGHRFFVSVLEEVLRILQSAPNVTVKEEAPSLKNLFEALKLQETEEDDEATVHAPTENTSTKKADRPKFELETNQSEKFFAIFAFFKDMNDIRDYIKSVWDDYLNHRLDIMSAAVTTDTAFTLLKESSAELLESQSLKH